MAQFLEWFGLLIYAAIGVASVVAAAVVIERVRQLLPWQRAFQETLARFEQHGRPVQTDGASDEPDPLSRCLQRGWAVRERGAEAVRVAAWEAAQQAVAALERGLGVIVTVAQITPLLGLLGTVAGLMQAFQAASSAEQITTGLLAGGIYQALGTTAAGLAVAIPAWIASGALDGWVHRLTTRLEIALAELPDLVHHGEASK